MCVLLFHPDHWNLLIDNGLIAANELVRIREFTWASLMMLPKDLLDIAAYVGSHQYRQKSLALPLVSLMKVALTVHNEGRLRDSSFLLSMARYAGFAGINRPRCPTRTTWYLTELAEACGKHELFTRQSPQKLKVLLKKLGQMPKPLKPASTQLAADILEKEHRIVEVMETIQRRLTKAE